MVSAINSFAVGEISEGQLNGYAALLVISGILMVVLGATGLGQSSIAERLINVVIGLAFLGYGAYLLLLFDGGTVWILWYVFIVPVLLIVQAVRRLLSRTRAT